MNVIWGNKFHPFHCYFTFIVLFFLLACWWATLKTSRQALCNIFTSWAIAPKLWIYFFFHFHHPSSQIFWFQRFYPYLFLHRMDGIILKSDMMILFSGNMSGFRIFSELFQILRLFYIFSYDWFKQEIMNFFTGALFIFRIFYIF